MKYYLAVVLLFPFLVFSQKTKDTKSNDKQIQAYFDYKVFQIPNENKAYIECYLEFLGTKINYRPVNTSDLQGRIALQYELRRGDSVYFSNAYRMDTPIMKDSIVDNFYEVFRINAPVGVYELNINLLDVNSDQKPVQFTQAVEIPEIPSTASLSDPIIAEVIRNADGDSSRFEKNGLLIYPRLRNLFESNALHLPFYIEAYNLDTTKLYLLKWKIQNEETKKDLIAYSGVKKLGKVKNQVIKSSVNIKDLPTGTYNLILELSEDNKKTWATKTYFFAKQTDVLADLSVAEDEDIIIDPAFQASITEDSLSYYLNSLRPIVGRNEQSHILRLSKEKNPEKIRNYFERLWIAMAKYTGKGTKPYDLWLAYKGQVQLVQQKFGAYNMPGYFTDRGRVYLQYGSPSSIITQETSPSEYPYEIWHYDKIKEFSNRTFVFYSPTLIPNKYELLHSDMVGELQNYRWQHDLTKRNSPVQNIDDPNDGNVDHFGGNSSIYYNQH